jgi:hypothetical protein
VPNEANHNHIDWLWTIRKRGSETENSQKDASQDRADNADRAAEAADTEDHWEES